MGIDLNNGGSTWAMAFNLPAMETRMIRIASPLNARPVWKFY